MAALPTPCPPVRPNCRSRVPFGLAPIVGAVLGLAASGAGHAGDCPADVNGDTLVDGVDLGVVLAFWGEPPALFPPADINGDGAIDAADLTLVLGAWGECPFVGCPTEFAWQPGFEQAPAQYWGTGVYALETFNDGRGNALYAGGWFNRAGGVAAANIAKWDGTAWTALGSGLDGPVDALAIFDDGTGPALYAGGRFTTAGGVEANRIAKWDGAEWIPLGSGLSGASSYVVLTLTVFDDGNGPALYAGGGFTTAGGSPANRVARWDGTSWAAVGSGPGMAWVFGLATIAGPEGPELVAGGNQNGSACNLQRWNGKSWSVIGACGFDQGSYCNACTEPLAYGCWTIASLHTPVAPGFPELLVGGGKCGGIGWSQDGFVDLSGGLGIPGNPLAPPYPLVFAWEAFDDGSGTKIYAGGPFLTAGGQPVRGVAAWDGEAWFEVGGGVEIEGAIELGLDGSASALTVFDDGTGPALYAGGSFTTAGGISSNRIATWDGSEWTPLSSGMNSTVSTLTVFDDGTGPALFAGGSFTTAGGIEANRIAKWDAEEWSPFGSGINYSVLALTVFDDGTGPALYAGGDFTTAGGVEANRIAKWDEEAWSPLGSGVNGSVYALTVFDDGTGPALYAGGNFSAAGSTPSGRIAKWDGSGWSPVGSGMSNSVLALAVFDDGTGPALYAGGSFTTAGGVEANRIAKWNGAEWMPLGSGMNDSVRTLTVFDDGTGPALYAGGNFTTAGGVEADRIAKWDGAEWTPLGSGMSSSVLALTAFDNGTGPALFAGGSFTTAGDIPSGRIAKWGCTPLGVRGWHGHSDAEATAGDTGHDEFARPIALMPIGLKSPGSSSIEQKSESPLDPTIKPEGRDADDRAWSRPRR